LGAYLSAVQFDLMEVAQKMLLVVEKHLQANHPCYVHHGHCASEETHLLSYQMLADEEERHLPSSLPEMRHLILH